MTNALSNKRCGLVILPVIRLRLGKSASQFHCVVAFAKCSWFEFPDSRLLIK